MLSAQVVEDGSRRKKPEKGSMKFPEVSFIRLVYILLFQSI